MFPMLHKAQILPPELPKDSFFPFGTPAVTNLPLPIFVQVICCAAPQPTTKGGMVEWVTPILLGSFALRGLGEVTKTQITDPTSHLLQWI